MVRRKKGRKEGMVVRRRKEGRVVRRKEGRKDGKDDGTK